MKRKLTKVLSVSLPPELEKKVGLTARRRGVTRSEFIRAAVLDALVEQGSRTALRMKVQSAP